MIALKQYVPRSKLKPAFTRRNLFLRDKYTCQYCGAASAVRDNRCDLTYDHVMPRSRSNRIGWCPGDTWKSKSGTPRPRGGGGYISTLMTLVFLGFFFLLFFV